ncbi:L,D-transpeptidase, partial [PVC group bacterium]|nr:L,D-transpeptidase [PVC group bacterium]
EPDTIGTDSSMGCVRLHEEDVSQIYEMLVEGVSTVEIR